MKKIIVFALLLAGVVKSYSQETATTVASGEPMVISKVIKADSMNIESIFTTLSQWITSTYTSEGGRVTLSDKENGLLVGSGAKYYKPQEKMYDYFSGYVTFTIDVTIKDGRYKVELKNFIHTANTSTNPKHSVGLITTAEEGHHKGVSKSLFDAVYRSVKESMKTYSEEVFSAMEAATNQGRSTAKKDDW